MGVYFGEAAGAGYVKIGYCRSPQNLFMRGYALKTEARAAICGHRFAADDFLFLGCWPLATLDDERAIQSYFAPARHSGEWFRATDELIAFAAAAYPVDLALAFGCPSWADYAGAFAHPPLCDDWLEEEQSLPAKQRWLVSGQTPRAAAFP